MVVNAIDFSGSRFSSCVAVRYIRYCSYLVAQKDIGGKKQYPKSRIDLRDREAKEVRVVCEQFFDQCGFSCSTWAGEHNRPELVLVGKGRHADSTPQVNTKSVFHGDLMAGEEQSYPAGHTVVSQAGQAHRIQSWSSRNQCGECQSNRGTVDRGAGVTWQGICID